MDRIFLLHIVVFSVLVATTSQLFADFRYPCDSKWITPLKQHYRNTGFDTRARDTPMCDNQLKRGWYMFVDATGAPTEIATRCPGSNTCGTSTPLWMNGSHPQTNDGIVARRVCGQSPNGSSSGCCDTRDVLLVKNCGGFYVFYLTPTRACPSSYCAGNAKRCGVGQWSYTSLEPCEDLDPVLTKPPVVKGPNVHPNQTMDFQCQIPPGPNDSDQVFQVTWTFNNRSDPSIKPQVLIGSQKVATLSGDMLMNHLDTDVGCQVLTYYVPERSRNTYSSQTINFGVQFLNLTGPYVQGNRSFHFECDVTTSARDPHQIIEVVWTFDGERDPGIEPQLIKGQAAKATLDGTALTGHINSHVGCEARLIYGGHGMKSAFRKSNTYFAGIQVSPGRLEIRDSEGERTLTVTSSIPVVCDGPGDCCLTFRTQVHKHTGLVCLTTGDQITTSPVCQEGLQSVFIVVVECHVIEIACMEKGRVKCTGFSFHARRLNTNCDECSVENLQHSGMTTLKDSCDYKLCLSDWHSDQKRASLNVTVVPSRNAVSGGTRESVLSFGDVLVSGTGPYFDIFKSVRLDPIQIVVHLEAGYKCSITGDPHVQGFDFKRVYDLYQTGDYTVLTVRDRAFLVQIRTWPCWAVTCVCGLAVREANDIIRVYGCDKPGNLVSSDVNVAYTLSPGTVVRRSSNGQHVGILLSSGSEINIELYNSYMNVYIQTPAYDKNKASGICGTNDANPDNDFTHPDGTVTAACSDHGRCVPVAFTDSWRVTGAESLFTTSPKQDPENPAHQYCTCPAISGDKPGLSCSPRQHIQDSNILCKDCTDITSHLRPSPWGQPGQTEKPYTHTEVKSADPNKSWPNDAGITESQAKEMCSKAIEKSQLYHQCKDTSSLVDSAMAECLGDVLDGGTNDTLPAVTSSFTSKCQMAAASDGGNYERGSDGGMTLKKEFSDDLCPGECTEHGACTQNGTCECQAGWRGNACNILADKGPQISWTSGSPWCDVNQMPCQHFQFDKSNVNIHDKLKCRVQPLNDQGNKPDQPSVVDAEGVSSTRVSCPLPKTNLSSQNYSISVTSDGILYGNELPVYTFDSVCLRCDEVGCSVKTNSCHINYVCYSQGQTNDDSRQLVCDATRDRTRWSPVTDPVRAFTGISTDLRHGTTVAHLPGNASSNNSNHDTDSKLLSPLSDSTSDRSVGSAASVRDTQTRTDITDIQTRTDITDIQTHTDRDIGLTTFIRSTDLTTPAWSQGPALPDSNNNNVSPQAISADGGDDITTSRMSNGLTPAADTVDTIRMSNQTTAAADTGNTTRFSDETAPVAVANGTTASNVAAETTSSSDDRVAQFLEQFVQRMQAMIARLRKQ